MLRDHYPAGVPCWIDLSVPDADAARRHYTDLFGWEFELRTPPESPASYAYARAEGATVGAIGSPGVNHVAPGWTMWVCVDSADASADLVTAHGGTIITPAMDFGTTGRAVLCADPEGARFGLWQPQELQGAERVNDHASWNFSNLHTADPAAAARFYGAVFGWELASWDGSPDPTEGFFRRPGYGAFLAERDPAVAEAHANPQIPPGFQDSVTCVVPLADGTDGAAARWSTTFAVADADAAFERAVAVGAEVVTEPFDTPWTRESVVRDPFGAELTLSEYRPS